MRRDRFTITAQAVLAVLLFTVPEHGVFAEPSKTAPPDLRVSAQVDKTEVSLGDRLTLTITIEGDFTKAQLQPFEFPKALEVVAEQRATNLSLQLGKVRRSLSVVYVLLAQEPGTWQLGPFQILHQGQPLLTEPIEITIQKPLLPPRLEEHPRYTL